MTNLIDRTLGRYRIVQEIGRGGMGAVYKAYDPNLNRHVAIKVLAQHLTWDQSAVDRFHREAQTVAGLSHPNIVAIHNVGEQDGIHYLVMDYVEGDPLSSLIARRGPLAPEQAAPILRQVAEALEYAHRQGLVHRDVKPGNILVSHEGRVALTDFGIARMAEGTRLTATGVQLGTPQYMSPEQAQGGAVDARTDVYALGVVLYEMLTGHVPFRADTPLAVLHQQVHVPPPPLRTIVPSLSREIEQVVLRALAKSPAGRYPRAVALATAFQEALAGKKTTAPITLDLPPRLKGRPWLYVATGLMSIAFIAALVLATKDHEAPVSTVTATLSGTNPVAMVTTALPTDEDTAVSTSAPTRTRRVAISATPENAEPTRNPTATRRPRTPTPTRTRRPTSTNSATPTTTPTATPLPGKVPVSPDNAATIRLIRTLQGHALDVLGIAFSPDGQTIASASDDKTIRLWRASDGKVLRTLNHSDTVYSVAFSSDGSRLVSGSRDKTARLWQVGNGQLLYTLSGHKEKAWCVAYSPRDTFVASGSGDKTVRVWNAGNGRLLYTLQGHTKPVYGLSFSPDGALLASGAADNTIRVWRMSDGQTARSLSGHGDNVRAVAFSPDGTILGSASFDKTIRLWSVGSGQLLMKLTGHADSVLSLAFSSDGRLLASGSADKTIRVWRVSDGQLLATLQGHKSRVTGVAFSPDGKSLVSSSDDRTIKLWGALSSLP